MIDYKHNSVEEQNRCNSLHGLFTLAYKCKSSAFQHLNPVQLSPDEEGSSLCNVCKYRQCPGIFHLSPWKTEVVAFVNLP